MSVFEDSTTNGWIHAPGPITLRQTRRVERARQDVKAAEGIVLSVLIGVNIIIGIIILCELFL